MSEPEKNRATEQPVRREKKPYQKPAFEYEEVFETMALACHINPQGRKVGKVS